MSEVKIKISCDDGLPPTIQQRREILAKELGAVNTPKTGPVIVQMSPAIEWLIADVYPTASVDRHEQMRELLSELEREEYGQS
jgi:hypothetical protein